MRHTGREVGTFRPKDSGDLILALHIHPGRVVWSAMIRTRDGRSTFDRHVDSGTLPHEGAMPGPPEALAMIRAATDAWAVSRRLPPAQPVREPGRAVGEQPRWVDQPLPGL